MSNKKITAVDWLYNQITNPENNLTWKEVFKTAKEMEKSQIKSAFDMWNIRNSIRGFKRIETAEQYYNNNYKNIKS